MKNSLLEKETVYLDKYEKGCLTAIPRSLARDSLGIKESTYGLDIWNGYDFTWLDKNLECQFNMITIKFPANSVNMIESKSLKIYLYSFANSSFNNEEEVKRIISRDLSDLVKAEVVVDLSKYLVDLLHFDAPAGVLLDNTRVTCDKYEVFPAFIETKKKTVSESLVFNAFKSNCPMTNKPDFAQIRIKYQGPKLVNDSLVKYLTSFRNHKCYHEACIELIYTHIMQASSPLKLYVEGRFARRGNLDINPIRCNFDTEFNNYRSFLQ